MNYIFILLLISISCSFADVHKNDNVDVVMFSENVHVSPGEEIIFRMHVCNKNAVSIKLPSNEMGERENCLNKFNITIKKYFLSGKGLEFISVSDMYSIKDGKGVYELNFDDSLEYVFRLIPFDKNDKANFFSLTCKFKNKDIPYGKIFFHKKNYRK